jgi:hypothetical protein
MDAGQATKDQIQGYLDSIGYEGEFDTKPGKPVKSTSTIS